MSLRFCFGAAQEDPDARRWGKLFELLTKEEQTALVEQMPFILMACGVRHVSEATIPHIIARLKLLEAGSARTFTEDLRVLHLLVAHGHEAVEKYIAVREKTYVMLREALPPDFEPEPAEALKRFIGLHVNVVTEPSGEFLRSLFHKVRDPFPQFTSAQVMRESKEFNAMVFDVRDGKTEHPALTPATVPS